MGRAKTERQALAQQIAFRVTGEMHAQITEAVEAYNREWPPESPADPRPDRGDLIRTAVESLTASILADANAGTARPILSIKTTW